MRLRHLWLLASVSFGALLLAARTDRRASASRRGADRNGDLGRGRQHGRRAGQRQEGRLEHHHHGGQRRQGQFQLPGRPALRPASTRSRSARPATSSTGRRKRPSRPARPPRPTSSSARRATSSPRCRTPNGCSSLPGSDQQKQFMINCVGCHTLQRVLTSSHTAEEYQQVFKRMGTYSPGSVPAHPQPLLPGPRGERPPISANEAPAAARVSRQRHARQSGRDRNTASSSSRVRTAAPPRSSSPNTICRAKRRSRMT